MSQGDRIGRVSFKEGDDYPLVGFIEEGKYGPELRLVSVFGGEFKNATKIVCADKEGNESELSLPKWPVRLRLEEGVTLRQEGRDTIVERGGGEAGF